MPTDRLTLRFLLLWSCGGFWAKFPQGLCFVFSVGSSAEGVRFPASMKILIYLKILKSPRAHKAGQDGCTFLVTQSNVRHSELLLKPFSSAAASCACEQCCCVTHMQLPEMLCNGRRQEGELSLSEPAKQRAGWFCCSAGGGVFSSLSPSSDWRRHRQGGTMASTRPGSFPPTLQQENPGPAPRGLRMADFRRRQWEEKALTHSIGSGRLAHICPCCSLHPSPQGHLLLVPELPY